MRPAVFLDRDDTLIACRELPAAPPPCAPGDLIDPGLVRLLPGVLEGCRSLRRTGFALVVVSNQGVVARGGATCAVVDRVNARVGELLIDGAGRPLVERFYYCPFHPKGRVPEFTREHPWRKPAPGMILGAAEELGLDVSRSWLIGDAERDIAAGIGAGLTPERCVRVGEGVSFADAVQAVLAGRRA
ncbi:MAG TPA: HAD-IIIA family hydrolase [Phycisphaerales bacterium]|nr:HAD-IIIA family hydrolase [Phycisphaerales bacterium]